MDDIDKELEEVSKTVESQRQAREKIYETKAAGGLPEPAEGAKPYPGELRLPTRGERTRGAIQKIAESMGVPPVQAQKTVDTLISVSKFGLGALGMAAGGYLAPAAGLGPSFAGKALGEAIGGGFGSMGGQGVENFLSGSKQLDEGFQREFKFGALAGAVGAGVGGVVSKTTEKGSRLIAGVRYGKQAEEISKYLKGGGKILTSDESAQALKSSASQRVQYLLETRESLGKEIGSIVKNIDRIQPGKKININEFINSVVNESKGAKLKMSSDLKRKLDEFLYSLPENREVLPSKALEIAANADRLAGGGFRVENMGVLQGILGKHAKELRERTISEVAPELKPLQEGYGKLAGATESILKKYRVGREENPEHIQNMVDAMVDAANEPYYGAKSGHLKRIEEALGNLSSDENKQALNSLLKRSKSEEGITTQKLADIQIFRSNIAFMMSPLNYLKIAPFMSSRARQFVLKQGLRAGPDTPLSGASIARNVVTNLLRSSVPEKTKEEVLEILSKNSTLERKKMPSRVLRPSKLTF